MRMKRLRNGEALTTLITRWKNGLKVAIDCSLQEHMSDKEITMTAHQTLYSFAANLRSQNPLFLHLTGLHSDTRLHRALNATWQGFSNPALRASELLPYDIHPPQDVVYLSPDSENVLDSLDDRKVYVIGGLVDLCVMKSLTQFKATQLGLHTACLPVKEYMRVSSSSVHHINLPINLVVNMLISVTQ
eukprot:Em0016g1087a